MATIIDKLKIKIKEKFFFKGSKHYWEERYRKGGNSGSGSYNRLAAFKADVLNDFVKKNQILTVIELGCGDGNQLSLARYPHYTGLDVSAKAIEICREKFKGDVSKTFLLYDPVKPFAFEKAELALSLDVLYHLIEYEVFERYLQDLFTAASAYVIIYAIDVDEPKMYHVHRRRFTPWIEANAKDFELVQRIPNQHRPVPGKFDPDTSDIEFFIYKRKAVS